MVFFTYLCFLYFSTSNSLHFPCIVCLVAFRLGMMLSHNSGKLLSIIVKRFLMIHAILSTQIALLRFPNAHENWFSTVNISPCNLSSINECYACLKFAHCTLLIHIMSSNNTSNLLILSILKWEINFPCFHFFENNQLRWLLAICFMFRGENIFWAVCWCLSKNCWKFQVIVCGRQRKWSINWKTTAFQKLPFPSKYELFKRWYWIF